MRHVERLAGGAIGSTTGFSASARIGCFGLPSAPVGTCAFIAVHTSLATVMPLPFRSIENAVTTCAFVPMPIVAPSGWPASMCAPSSSPVMHAVEQHLPVRLRLERDEQALVLEVAELVGDRERRHVGELDEAELQLVLLERERARRAPRARRS